VTNGYVTVMFREDVRCAIQEAHIYIYIFGQPIDYIKYNYHNKKSGDISLKYSFYQVDKK